MKKALTMGELLVTMSIIGVVAVLVLPGFMRSYEERVYLTKLKKVVETIETAVNQACIENNVSFFYQTRFSIPISDGNLLGSARNNQQDFLNQYFKTVGTRGQFPFAGQYKILSTGEEKKVNAVEGAAYAKLATGEAISLICPAVPADSNCYFRIDTNSKSRPNVGGRDFFEIWLDKKTNMLYDGLDATKCGSDEFGRGCFVRIRQEHWEMTY